ncbi:LysR family transcriptional regulator [Pseudoxanthomonas sp.]|uniref:LysR family transcriptional regulator n=1 Tax=Pseudoxanthomonas sp. TaxID=1871049 RepID=UPI00262E72CC|nr:LysR family transcriptional regulator [Pseudoxanthomonas sp.]WDS37016.1 MAG: LysR family transcriptional regulator [Pseudoxanthomonas sp.]
MASTIRWELYRSFLGVLEAGTLSGAARALGITQPTVGRHIAALEQALGVVLFTRSQVGLMPTAVALSLRAHAEAMDHTAASLERAASSGGQAVQGVVRVSASDVICVEVLPPIITQLRARYPELKVELVLTDRVQDLLRREADIAVRMVQPDQLQLIARRVGVIDVGLFAHARYLERHGTPASINALADHAVIGYDQASAFIRKVEQSVRGFGRELFSLRTDSNVAQLALIRSGAGIGACQALVAARDPALVRVLADQFSIQLETWITMHEGLRNNAACRVTFDALAEGLLAYAG